MPHSTLPLLSLRTHNTHPQPHLLQALRQRFRPRRISRKRSIQLRIPRHTDHARERIVMRDAVAVEGAEAEDDTDECAEAGGGVGDEDGAGVVLEDELVVGYEDGREEGLGFASVVEEGVG